MNISEDKCKLDVFGYPTGDKDGNKATILQVLLFEKSEERKVFVSPVARKKKFNSVSVSLGGVQCSRSKWLSRGSRNKWLCSRSNCGDSRSSASSPLDLVWEIQLVTVTRGQTLTHLLLLLLIHHSLGNE